MAWACSKPEGSALNAMLELKSGGKERIRLNNCPNDGGFVRIKCQKLAKQNEI